MINVLPFRDFILSDDSMNAYLNALRNSEASMRNYLLSEQFLVSLIRQETFENPYVFCKAIRCTLLALGYDSDFVEINFRETLERYVFNDLNAIE